ncbi:Ig-like domain-containing protein [Candidatus Solirubrobacter pratensis]|uniref:Ig-like domain-containing protein n=1 Tax=Candidatus Solirubrobacter pratensis TaxID=1298857 RepID=UPI00041CBF29|nr:Ig-like domain-containing protein [Candidatus Solirubrobacter pratensis]
MFRRMLVAALAATAMTAAPASADEVSTIAGTPLTVHVGDHGQLQAFRAGEASGFFYRPSSQLGDAGFFLAFPGTQPLSLATKVFGFDGAAGPDAPPLTPYTTFSKSAATGAGTPDAPFKQVTVYDVPAAARITQTTSYVNGAQEFTVRWDVKNISGSPLRYKALAAADFYFEGSDRGTGVFTQGPPRFIGGTNADTGRSGGFVEVPSAPAWTHYQALEYGGNVAIPDVWDDKIEVAGASTSPTFDDTVEGQPTDNAGGVEWDDTLTGDALAPNATKTYSLVVRSALPAALQFDKTNAGAPQRTPIAFIATAKDTSGQPFTGKPLRFSITGANPLSSAATIDAAGNAVITDPGTNAGADTIVAFVDLNGDGARQDNEPQASTLATFIDNIPPACTVKVTGDRPGGGGAGKPLVVTVNCDSPVNVTTASTFTITPRKKKAHASAKPKKKPKKVVIKLPVTNAQVLTPGQAVPVAIKVPKSIAKKYAGAKVSAKVVVTAADAAGNKVSKTARRTLTLRAVKAKKKKKG